MDNKRYLNQSKGFGQITDKKDFSTNKQVARALPRRREQPSFSKQDTARPTNNNNKPKNKNNVDKQLQMPRARGGGNIQSANGATGLTEADAAFESEVNSIYSPGSKKQSLNHLLNFHYAPREQSDAHSLKKTGNHNAAYRSKPRYNKEQFLQANCQFVVRDGYGFDYSAFLSTPDALVDWNQIEQVNVRSAETPQCPICLYAPVAAKMTRCGHVYCWPCILHYLALSDKAWRKCPICFTSVYSVDLKSAVAKPQTVYKVGDRITLCLMRREKNSLQIERVSAKEQKAVDTIPRFFDDAEKRLHSKLVLAGRDEILHILEREKMELKAQLDYDGHDCPEAVFVEEALHAVLQRIQQLFGGEEVPVSEYLAKPEIAAPIEELGEATGGEEVVLAPDQAIDEDTDLTINDIVIAGGANTNYHYFYQAVDGQNLFLHSLNSRLLQAGYGSLEQSPLTVTGKIVQKDCCSLSDDLRKRLRYLQHLPVSSSFEIVELELDRGLIGQEVLDRFHGEMVQRRKLRQRKNREENIRERHISELNDRQMGLSMAKSANIEIRSSQQFPSWSTTDDAPELLSTSLASDIGAASPNSFAKILTATQVPLWPALPSSAAPQGNQYNHLRSASGTQPSNRLKKSSESDFDDELAEFVRAPTFEHSLSSVISEALEKASLKSPTEPTAGKKGKKKGKKKQICLFSSGMAFN